MKLSIVIGHEEKAQGAMATAPISASEYRYNSALAEVIYRMAKEKGIDCRVIKRDRIGIRGAYEAVNEWIKEDEHGASVELHFNSFNRKVRGTETLFDSDPADSLEFARFIHNEILNCFNRTGKQDRGLKKLGKGDRGYFNLKECQVPGCIIEGFFGDNPDDAKLGHELMFEYAASIVKGAMEYFRHCEKIETMHA